MTAEILGYTRHPASAVWPDLTEDEYARLRDNIAAQGQDHPILVTPEMVVIDGWHRLKACAELDRYPNVTVCRFSEREIGRKINGAHEGRRHLTLSETALYVVETLRACGGEYAEAGQGRPTAVPGDAKDSDKTDQVDTVSAPPPVISRRTVAQQAGVSEPTAARAIARAKEREGWDDPPDDAEIERRARQAGERARSKQDRIGRSVVEQLDFFKTQAETLAEELEFYRARRALDDAVDETDREDAAEELGRRESALASQIAEITAKWTAEREARMQAEAEAADWRARYVKLEEGLHKRGSV